MKRYPFEHPAYLHLNEASESMRGAPLGLYEYLSVEIHLDPTALPNTLQTHSAVRQVVQAQESEMGSEVRVPFKPPCPTSSSVLVRSSTSNPKSCLVCLVRAPSARPPISLSLQPPYAYPLSTIPVSYMFATLYSSTVAATRLPFHPVYPSAYTSYPLLCTLPVRVFTCLLVRPSNSPIVRVASPPSAPHPHCLSETSASVKCLI